MPNMQKTMKSERTKPFDLRSNALIGAWLIALISTLSALFIGEVM